MLTLFLTRRRWWRLWNKTFKELNTWSFELLNHFYLFLWFLDIRVTVWVSFLGFFLDFIAFGEIWLNFRAIYLKHRRDCLFGHFTTHFVVTFLRLHLQPILWLHFEVSFITDTFTTFVKLSDLTIQKYKWKLWFAYFSESCDIFDN